MARSKKRWRRWRRHVRAVLFAFLLISIVPGLIFSAAAGEPWPLFIVPMGMLGALVATPFVLLTLLVALLAVALPFAILAAVFGGPLYLVYRLAGGGRRRRSDEDDEVTLSPEVLLRRRYVAGELTYQQFQTGMVDVLKDRFARGELPISEYEAELEKLLQPARHLDVTRDPALAGALRDR
ncbi:MAG: hypothetical protein ACRDI2_19710 [Chloroflexota bacterium]